MSYTNVEIPNRYNTITQLREKVYELESKIKWLSGLVESYEAELHNIPKAILEYGFVQITYDKHTLKVGQIP